MQTPPLLSLSGWSIGSKLYPCISTRLSGVGKSWKISDNHIQSYLYVETYAFSCTSFEKLCAVILFRFQWQRDTVFSFLISLDLDLTQYLHGVVEEQKYGRRLIKNGTFKLIKTKKEAFK